MALHSGWPAAVAPSPNRIDLFCVGADGVMYHKWREDGKAWLPDQLKWESLGGQLRVGYPAAVSWGPNRLDIFGSDSDHALYHKWWDGSRWQPGRLDWVQIGLGFSSPLSAVARGPNRLDVFCLSPNGVMHHRALEATGWEPAWTSLGGNFVSAPAVTSWGPNRLDVFGQSLDGTIYHKWWEGKDSFPSPFVWEDLGKPEEFEPPAAVSWGANRLDLFALSLGPGGSTQAVHKWWWPNVWGPIQQDWQPLGGDFSRLKGGMAAVAWGSDRLDIFAIHRVSESLYHLAWDGTRWQPEPLTAGWENLGSAFEVRPAVVARGPNRLDVFGIGADGVWHKWCNADVHVWSPGQLDWELLGQPEPA